MRRRPQSESGWTGLWKKASASCIRLRTTHPTSWLKISDQARNELRAAKIPAGKVPRSPRELAEDLFSLLARWRYGANDFYENPAVRDLESAKGGIHLLDDATDISFEYCAPLPVAEWCRCHWLLSFCQVPVDGRDGRGRCDPAPSTIFAAAGRCEPLTAACPERLRARSRRTPSCCENPAPADAGNPISPARSRL